ncbi:hypothetical protein H5410_022101 [Solanum commersonii]|uniref:AT-hook motif nuclear-localized protein n=1 Tax=Solanum commersonii TaxID=4109 RepID=A0A9J5ZH36_SOLCO|nr:hypothetical protein H5410_022101 [Solanum commersonii]
MNSPNSSVDVNTAQILLNHGENFGVVGMPQLIRVKVGEDIVLKIMDFAQQEEMKISVQSVTGEVSSVTLQSAMGGDIVTHEPEHKKDQPSYEHFLPPSQHVQDRNIHAVDPLRPNEIPIK